MKKPPPVKKEAAFLFYNHAAEKCFMKKLYCFLILVVVLLNLSCSPRVISTESSPFEKAEPTHSELEPVSNVVTSYVGLIYPPLPESIRISTSWGATISPSSSHDSWSVVTVSDGENLMLWLSKFLYSDRDGKPYSEVSDVAILPSSAGEYDVIVSACLLQSVLDPEIVALVKVSDENLENRYITNSDIILTWRADRSLGKLKQISTIDIECHAETFLNFP